MIPEVAARITGLVNDEEHLLGQEARSTLDEQVRCQTYRKMLDMWEDEALGTVLYNPVEFHGVGTAVNWSPCSFCYIDFRPYDLSSNWQMPPGPMVNRALSRFGQPRRARSVLAVALLSKGWTAYGRELRNRDSRIATRPDHGSGWTPTGSARPGNDAERRRA